MATSPAQAAIHEVERVLRIHHRTISASGSGWRCQCGSHFTDAAQFDNHVAEIATAAAARHLPHS